MATQKQSTMKAVIFHGPYKIAVEERPVPQILDDTDVIVKATYTALCGRYMIGSLHKFTLYVDLTYPSY